MKKYRVNGRTFDSYAKAYEYMIQGLAEVLPQALKGEVDEQVLVKSIKREIESRGTSVYELRMYLYGDWQYDPTAVLRCSVSDRKASLTVTWLPLPGEEEEAMMEGPDVTVEFFHARISEVR